MKIIPGFMLLSLMSYCCVVQALPEDSKPAPATSPPSLTCGDALPPVTINFSPDVPDDIANFSNQLIADCFAWAEFVALNWPTASGAGFGDPEDLAPVQWQTYMDAGLLFPSDGSKPPAWGTQPPVPPDCATQAGLSAEAARTTRVYSMTSKFDSPFSIHEAAPADGPNWLGAQNNTNVWYEITVSRDEYNYVVQNGLYNANTQASFVNNGSGSPIVLPKGCSTNIGESCPEGTMLGAIELKAAWMEAPDYGNNTRWSRYKVIPAVVIDPATQQCRKTTLALVGLHILHKTTNQPTWIWATFEHVDNVPSSSSSTPPPGGYNFFNAECTNLSVSVPTACVPNNTGSGNVTVTVGCTANTSPPYYLGQGCPGPVPIQVTRVTPLDSNATSANQTVQPAIQTNYPNSVWQYYQLVDVLWSTNPVSDPSKPISVPHPLASLVSGNGGLVANTTLETYAQDTTCTSCHQYAAIAPASSTCPSATGGSKGPCESDFSFLFGQVGPPQANLRPLKRPVTGSKP